MVQPTIKLPRARSSKTQGKTRMWTLLREPIDAAGRQLACGKRYERQQFCRITKISVAGQQGHHEPVQASDGSHPPGLMELLAEKKAMELGRHPAQAVVAKAAERENGDDDR